MTAIRTGGESPQVAVVASRRVGGAVDRNRARRRLRAALEPLVRSVPGDVAAVVAATPETNHMNFQELGESVARALRTSRTAAASRG